MLFTAVTRIPDIAPLPTHREGLSLASPATTRVAMTAETVDLTLHQDVAEVQAWFELVNRGDQPEVLEVGFPTQARPLPDVDLCQPDAATAIQRATSGFEAAFLFAFSAAVDGAPVQHAELDLHRPRATDGLTGEVPDRIFRTHQHWVSWRMKFAPGQRREVAVRYQVTTRDDMYLRPFSPLGPRELLYVLKTGALWEGPIGRATVRLHLGDDLSEVHLDEFEPAPTRRAGEPRHEGEPEPVAAWEFRDFEPDQDIRIHYRAFRDAAHAVPQLRGMLEQSPDNQGCLLDLAQNLEALDQPAEAAEVYARLATYRLLAKHVKARTRPRSMDALAARSYMAAGDRAAARRHVRKVRNRVIENIKSLQRTIDRHNRSEGELSPQQQRYLDSARERLLNSSNSLAELDAWLAEKDV